MPLWPNGFLTKRVVRAHLCCFEKFVEITSKVRKKGRQATKCTVHASFSDVQKDPPIPRSVGSTKGVDAFANGGGGIPCFCLNDADQVMGEGMPPHESGVEFSKRLLRLSAVFRSNITCSPMQVPHGHSLAHRSSDRPLVGFGPRRPLFTGRGKGYSFGEAEKQALAKGGFCRIPYAFFVLHLQGHQVWCMRLRASGETLQRHDRLQRWKGAMES